MGLISRVSSRTYRKKSPQPTSNTMFGDAQLSSAAGILSLLDDSDSSMKVYALERLNSMVAVYWPEISECLDKIEMLQENKSFEARELAALVAAKLYFQLGALDESMNYALSAGKYFDIAETSEFVETIAMQCFDSYIDYRQAAENDQSGKKCDERMEALVERMLRQSLDDGKLCEAAGLAIETGRYDILEDAIKGCNCSKVDEMIDYVSKICLTVIEESSLLKKILLLLVKISKEQNSPNYINVCSCLVHLDNAAMVAEIIRTLCTSTNPDDKLVGYQIAFDLYETANQGFMKRVADMAKSDDENDEVGKNLSKIISGDVTIGM